MTHGFSLAGVWDGKHLEFDKAEYQSCLRVLPIGPVTITVEKERRTRTGKQNRFYFSAIVEPLAKELGYEKDEMHEVLAMRFLRIEDCPVTGVPRRKPTPKCNTVEFTEYCESCIRLAAEHGVVVDAESFAA